MRGIRAGGLDAEKIEGLRVKLAKQAGVVRVGEVAQVVQRGRVMVVMVGEKEVCVELFFDGRLPSRFLPTLIYERKTQSSYLPPPPALPPPPKTLTGNEQEILKLTPTSNTRSTSNP